MWTVQPLASVGRIGEHLLTDHGEVADVHSTPLLVRFHQWHLTADDMGGSHLQCGKCSKTKRGGIPRSTSSADDAGGYGNLPGPMTG